jgi:hypothetical protein
MSIVIPFLVSDLLERANSGFNSNTLFNNYATGERAKGSRYPLVGRTKQRRFDGIQPEPRILLENVQTSTSRRQTVVDALLTLD